MLNFNNKKKDKIELRNILSQKISKYQKVTHEKNFILIAIVLLYILCYVRNLHLNILQIITGYCTYIDNITKFIIRNLYYICFLVIYKTIW